MQRYHQRRGKIKKKTSPGWWLVCALAAGSFLALFHGPCRNPRLDDSGLFLVGSAGRLYADGDSFDKAAAIYERGLQLCGQSPYLRLGMARAYFRKGDFLSAESAYREILGVDRNSPVALFNMAQCLVAQGREKDAIPYLLTFVDLYSKSLPALAGRARAALSTTFGRDAATPAVLSRP